MPTADALLAIRCMAHLFYRRHRSASCLAAGGVCMGRLCRHRRASFRHVMETRSRQPRHRALALSRVAVWSRRINALLFLRIYPRLAPLGDQ